MGEGYGGPGMEDGAEENKPRELMESLNHIHESNPVRKTHRYDLAGFNKCVPFIRFIQG